MIKFVACPDCQIVTSSSEERGYITGGVRKFAKYCSDCAKKQWLEWKRANSTHHYTKNKQSEEWVVRNRKMLQINHLKRTFGIDEQTYQKMFAEQGGVCACCGNSETTIDKRSRLPIRAVKPLHSCMGISGAFLMGRDR